MKNRVALEFSRSVALALTVALGVLPITSRAQDRLKTMPGYDQYQKMSKEIPGAVKLGTLIKLAKEQGYLTFDDLNEALPEGITDADDLDAILTRLRRMEIDIIEASEVDRYKDGKTYRFDIATLATTEAGTAPADAEGGRMGGRRRAGGPERGRQYSSAESPDKKLKAFYRDRNLWLSDASGTDEMAITTDGNEKARTKYGTGSWVYGEELDQTTAIWWSPNSKKIAFYRFDESPVPDYFLQLDQTRLQSKMDIEAYPKAGVNNPIADILIYDIDTKQTVKVDVRDGKPFDNSVVGHYAYNVQWSPDGATMAVTSGR